MQIFIATCINNFTILLMMSARNISLQMALLLVAISFYCVADGLENGLARTPPMGWMPFERFRCMTDCARFPRDCISETLIKRTAELLISGGYAAVGYQYVIIDDCWMEASRDETTHELLPSLERFPTGMSSLGDYIHSLGLKFGLYHDIGEKTCMFRGPGAARHFDLDAQTFANWGVDYVKMDGCYASDADLDRGYPAFGRALNRTGRPIVYSCSWPFYKSQPDYSIISQHCNLWRFAEDVKDSLTSVTNIMTRFSSIQNLLTAHSGPGRWNDPDMLVLGNFRLSYDASRLQMAIWAVLAAPLIMTNDLETVRPEVKELLQNRDIVAIDQDPLGLSGKKILQWRNIQVWARPVRPVNDYGESSFAVAFVNLGGFGVCPLCPQTFHVLLSRLGLQSSMGYWVVDLFNKNHSLGFFKPKDKFITRVNPEGVTFYKFTVGHSY
ncbi:alpha-N-acetylgalactosaminidase-like isoform X1 [Drosophila kikkawai]|uniref:Alpha-galactosidase n=1 Tax=Drosophila kikkawai TaxID=30033 RepID=A0A6P4JSQ1_DROKI|nr:alpha-N-acetylgalactosaminidase-like [Drosophila kikkawai]XP_041633244.1 alpha-N-acetylgalactosaminidase-like [Drosophila kikkawai]